MNKLLNTLFQISGPRQSILCALDFLKQNGNPEQAENIIMEAINNNEVKFDGSYIEIISKTPELKKFWIFLRKHETILPLVSLCEKANEFEAQFGFKYHIFNKDIRTQAINDFGYIPATSQERKALNKVLQS